MKVAIDISQIIYGTGVSVYTKELIAGLNEITDIDLVLYAGSLRRKSEFEKYKAKVFPVSPYIADLIWNKLHVLPIEYLIGKVDLIHTSDWSEPPSRVPKVTTVHDLSPILFPSESNPYVTKVHKRKLEWVKKESSAIIVPSKATKKDLKSLGFDDDKIHVVYEALSRNLKNQMKKRLIKEKYVLSIGTAPRKNIERIAKAFESVKDRLGISKYIVCGQIPDNKVPGVIYLGYVEDKVLGDLYRNAECLVYASLYEGFGLPILDAYSVQTPVVTSSISSMPEVAGDAAILVDPQSVSSISEGILESIRSKNVLVKKAVKQLEKFSWSRTADQTYKIYKQI